MTTTSTNSFAPSAPAARPCIAKFAAALLFATLLAPLLALLGGLLAFSAGSVHAAAQDNQSYEVWEFRDIDREYVNGALQRVNDLTTRHMGARLTGSAATDLDYLQRLLDDHLVARDDLQTLQAMGVAFAEVLRKQRYLKWVRYSDREGTSRALQLAHENYFIYPVTVIARRAAVGAEVDVRQLFQRNIAALDAYVESQRYQ